jgi:histidyl-tRNA synthetase
MADNPNKSDKAQSKAAKAAKPKARLPRGLADRGPAELAATRRMLDVIRGVYERYGFEPVETPAFEYTDALGKFLPDQDRPNEGVFSFQDDDEQWLSLRYDLTAPLARYVAENFETLPKPYRSYRAGLVFRNEKPGPGRFRQFMQFDADTVGSASPAADAEMCMMAADTMEALGVPRGSYLVKVNNRKVLDGVMEAIGLGGEENASRRLIALRALDKFDRLGIEGVRSLLGRGRVDETSDFTRGAELSPAEIDEVTEFVTSGDPDATREKIEALISASALGPDEVRALLDPTRIFRAQQRAGLDQGQIQDLLTVLSSFPGFHQLESAPHDPPTPDDMYVTVQVEDEKYALHISNTLTLRRMRDLCPGVKVFQEGIDELQRIERLFDSSGYRSGRILISPSVVRGLEYYTGPVFEVELTFAAKDGTRFGSVGGGGRYDGLVSRFRGEAVPATGFSVGVSRLLAALQHLGKIETRPEAGPVVVTVFDRERLADYQRMTNILRDAGIRAELYLGTSRNMGNQFKYADRRNSPCVVIQGGDEKAKGEVQIKDLIEGAKAAAAIASNQEWRESRPAQFAVAEDKLVAAVREVLDRHGVRWG